MSSINLPLLSEYDPVTSAEGGIDPLGLYAIADNLAVKLVPGVRERMTHPRYLTAIAIGTAITKFFEDDQLAADGQSEPWMAYEWIVVEGLVRSCGDDPELIGLPGIQKARECIRDQIPLCASRYLKSASVFGFHGVYRPLADNLDISMDGLLGERGYELVKAWENEQRMRGFYAANEGDGAWYRDLLYYAVKDSMTKGVVDRKGGWQGWAFFGEHLFPNRIPQNEAKIIAQGLVGEPNSPRSQVIRFLTSSKGFDVFKKSGSEKNFHLALRGEIDEDVRQLLDAIMVYEKLSRLLQDAFEDCLYAMTIKRGKISPSELSKEPGCQVAARKVPAIFEEVVDRLSLFDLSVRFINGFDALAEETNAKEWVNILLEHHVKVQRQKPPNGKNPWFERFDDGDVVVRPRYRTEQRGKHDYSYVNAYRTNSLLSFLTDLNMIEQ